jgi:hypothetical protein
MSNESLSSPSRKHRAAWQNEPYAASVRATRLVGGLASAGSLGTPMAVMKQLRGLTVAPDKLLNS